MLQQRRLLLAMRDRAALSPAAQALVRLVEATVAPEHRSAIDPR